MTNPGGRGALAWGEHEVVWLSGPDRLDFLHRLTTADLANLAIGAAAPTLLLDDSGRVVDLLTVYHGAAGTLLVTSGPGAAAAVTDHLRAYVLYGDDVRVTDASAQVTVVSLVGGDQEQVIGRLLGQSTPVPGDDSSPNETSPNETSPNELSPAAWHHATRHGEPVWALRRPVPGALAGWDIVAPAGDAISGIVAECDWPVAPDTYHAARLEAGLPAYGNEITPDDAPNPLELGRADLVDFHKGCYLGQEVVARLDTYRKVQRALVRLTAPRPASLAVGGSVLLPGGRTGQGRYKTGRVTSAVALPGGETLALALVPESFAAEVFLATPDGVTLHVAPV